MSDQKIYDHGRIAMDSGDLIDVTDFKISLKTGKKQVHTMRKNGAGIVKGNEESTASFNMVVSEDGEEADWVKLVKKNVIKQLRAKISGRTITMNGGFTAYDLESSSDNPDKVAIEFIGAIDD